MFLNFVLIYVWFHEGGIFYGSDFSIDRSCKIFDKEKGINSILLEACGSEANKKNLR